MVDNDMPKITPKTENICKYCGVEVIRNRGHHCSARLVWGKAQDEILDKLGKKNIYGLVVQNEINIYWVNIADTDWYKEFVEEIQSSKIKQSIIGEK